MVENETSILPLAVDLTIVDGPGKGRSIRVPVGSSLVVGRDDSADERLGGDESISRRHARLEHPQPGHLTVSDLNSTNGVYVAGRRISTATEIRPGERIELGQTALVLEPAAPDDRTQVIGRRDSGPPQIQAPSYEEQIRAGYGLLETEQASAAEEVFARATGFAPDRPDAYLARGLALMKLNRLDEAARALGDAVRHDQRLTEGWYRLGVVKHRQGDVKEALAYYRHALTIDSTHAGARQGVETLAPRPSMQESSPTTGMQPTAAASAPPGTGPMPPQVRTLAAAADAAAKGEGPGSWDQGELLKSAHRAMRSFGRQWLVVFALVGLAVATEPLLRKLRDAGFGGDGLTVDNDLYRNRSALIGALLALAVLTAAFIVLRSIFTQYHIYERRVDFTSGVLFRRKSSLWLYDVTDIDSERSLLMLLTNTAAVALRSEGAKVRERNYKLPALGSGQPKGARPTVDRIIGVGTAREMEQLWETLRTAALRERRAMKSSWV
jgi:tetratricopeptide (TPR) repeat protein